MPMMPTSRLLRASWLRCPEGVDLLPYHDIGKGKHARMGTTFNPEGIPMATPSDAELQHARAVIAAFGLPVS